MATSFLNSILGSPQRRRDPWFNVGFASTFPDNTSETILCFSTLQENAKCKVFLVPGPESMDTNAVEVSLDEVATLVSGDKREQILVFRFQGKFHAIKNKCPHEAYPLSNGALFDIEDFGIKLSAGITCPKHGWSYDLISGKGDRGNSKLVIWEVELRPNLGRKDGAMENEVWIRRKQMIG